MKKIINGKRYDTSTAKLVGKASYSNRGDFAYWSEELYLKRTGEFFIYGEGGPLSRYSRSTGQNQWSGGEKIIPLSIREAQEWAEEHLDGDEYEAIFGEVDEDKVQISFWIDRNDREKAYKVIEAFDVSYSDLFKVGLEHYFLDVKEQL
jgi:hypothetical protein